MSAATGHPQYPGRPMGNGVRMSRPIVTRYARFNISHLSEHR